MIQLWLPAIPQETSEERLLREVNELKAQCDRVRKGQYAKIGALTKMYLENKYELEMLKQALCRPTLTSSESTNN